MHNFERDVPAGKKFFAYSFAKNQMSFNWIFMENDSLGM